MWVIYLCEQNIHTYIHTAIPLQTQNNTHSLASLRVLAAIECMFAMTCCRVGSAQMHHARIWVVPYIAPITSYFASYQHKSSHLHGNNVYTRRRMVTCCVTAGGIQRRTGPSSFGSCQERARCIWCPRAARCSDQGACLSVLVLCGLCVLFCLIRSGLVLSVWSRLMCLCVLSCLCLVLCVLSCVSCLVLCVLSCLSCLVLSCIQYLHE